MGNAESRESTRTGRASTSALEPPRDAAATTRASLPGEPARPSRRSQSVHANESHQLPREAGGIERGQQATEEATGQLGYWYLIKNGYNDLVNLIIRPPRAEYDLSELGPSSFSFAGRDYERKDFEVTNARGMTLQCSHWLPVETTINGVTEFPCVIYLHGNSSCRLEAISVLRTCLSSGISVVAFDCAGCGKSEGTYISLGYYERDDLQAVIAYLREHSQVSTIGLWGRSMGAATALLHVDRDPTIAGLVVDSAFTNLEQLVQEIVEHGRREGYTIPAFLVKLVMKFIRSSVQKRAQFDIKDLSPIDHTQISFVPALFVAAKNDEFIAPHHSEQLHEQYAGEKNIVKVRGDHNSVRPQFLLDSAGIFLQSALRVDARLVPDLASPTSRMGGRPPWSYSSPRLQMMNLSAAFSGRYAKLVPREPWDCKVCTYKNEAFQMQCELCRRMYEPPEGMPNARRRRRATSPPGTSDQRLSSMSEGREDFEHSGGDGSDDNADDELDQNLELSSSDLDDGEDDESTSYATSSTEVPSSIASTTDDLLISAPASSAAPSTGASSSPKASRATPASNNTNESHEKLHER